MNVRTQLHIHFALALLTLATILLHGYHPLAEDGGLYVAGIQSALNPSLFPHDLEFVSATRHYSAFTPVTATVVRLMHIPLPWLLLVLYYLGTWLLLVAAWHIARRITSNIRAQWAAVGLIAAWYSIPVAGTSLLLMDPYVTARTLSTPLCLLAVSFALEEGAWLPCAICLAAAAFVHPLMTAYAAFLIFTLLIAKQDSAKVRRVGFIALATLTIALAASIQYFASPESPSTVAAAFSRYYWFLSQWQWYELLGLAGPLVVLGVLARTLPAAKPLCHAAIASGMIAIVVAVLFAQQHYATHMVARLQPLRAFLLIYAVMTILLGAAIAIRLPERGKWLAVLVPVSMAAVMFFVQRQTFPASQHLELPDRAPLNPWSRAFVWAREHTSSDALFAIDADYITTDGEDGQTFRATAQRSVVPDFSKDGGEVAIRPALSEAWFAGQHAQRSLSYIPAAERIARLQSMGVTWMVLHAGASVAVECPYKNAVVKVCPLTTAAVGTR